MKQIRIIISGRVQGVFFRANTRDIARQLNLKGFVRNLSNGDVEVIAQGNEKELNELISFCRKGPPGAMVDNINIKYEEIKENLTGFEVRY